MSKLLQLNKPWISLLVLMHGWVNLGAQNLENIGKGDAFTMNGGVHANQVLYLANGVDRRSPYNYFLSGNLTLGLYGWTVPLTFSYSDQQSSFQQPFNQYGMSPTYKWLTAHVGYRSMSFSNYTLNGHLFLGGGVELTPRENVRISALYGRFRKAVEEDTLLVENQPSYRRMGGGIKVSVGGRKHLVEVITFKARDNPHSLRNVPVNNDVRPQENLVLGLNASTTLAGRVMLKGEYAGSAITRDIRSEETTGNRVYDQLDFLFQPRVSSSYYRAFKGALQYKMNQAGLSFSYERVDPGYVTLGSYYFNNNLENISFNNSLILFRKKARVNWRLGLQRNNLDKKELSSMNRLSGAVNLHYMASPRATCQFSYTNFSTIVNFRSQFEDINRVSPLPNPDTLNYRQVAQNANMNLSYRLNDSKSRSQNLNVNLSYQVTADEQNQVEQPTGAKFYNFNSSYNLNLGPGGWTINVAANANVNKSLANRSAIVGPSVSARKSFKEKKLSTTCSISMNNAYTNASLSSRVINLRNGTNYSFQEKHQFSLNITGVNRFSVQNEAQMNFSEVTVQLGYNYNFGTN